MMMMMVKVVKDDDDDHDDDDPTHFGSRTRNGLQIGTNSSPPTGL